MNNLSLDVNIGLFLQWSDGSTSNPTGNNLRLILTVLSPSRKDVQRRLSSLSWEVLRAQSEACLQQVASRAAAGPGSGRPVAPFGPGRPVGPPVPFGLSASGRGPVGQGSAALGLHLQKVPHQVLQVPQHPVAVPAEGQPAGARNREPVRRLACR